MKDSERLKAVNQLIKHDPFAPTYQLSNVMMKFLVRLANEHQESKRQRYSKGSVSI